MSESQRPEVLVSVIGNKEITTINARAEVMMMRNCLQIKLRGDDAKAVICTLDIKDALDLNYDIARMIERAGSAA